MNSEPYTSVDTTSYWMPVASSRTFIMNPEAYPPKDFAEPSVMVILSERMIVRGSRE